MPLRPTPAREDTMLNWLKNQTLHNWSSAPIVNDGETIIDATAAQIYEKLDFATPLNAYSERGYVFGAGNPAYDIFEATDPGEPGKTLIFEVTEARPGKRYCYRTTIRDADADCPVIESSSEYTIIPQKDGRQLLHLQESSVLASGLNRHAYILERAKLNFSVFRTLARLRLHLELGTDLRDIN
ncbi:hypothetical protein [Hyphomonas atlantica]|uniref:Uncharacterized protein n=2 Tax=Hyphomonas atlantica TaxID=1280948 RepID=A0A3B9KXB6_9PROT|nr:hypothetical protein [Hyphomonas atlantica]HAE93352.1 hypothetical protein [Hyphomonas atlantica]